MFNRPTKGLLYMGLQVTDPREETDGPDNPDVADSSNRDETEEPTLDEIIEAYARS